MSESGRICQHCLSLNTHSTVTAIYNCTDCEEWLCLDCSRHHEGHQLTDVILATPLLHQISTQECTRHPLQVICYFCVDHDALCCRDCIPDVHLKCQSVLSVESASLSAKESACFSECEKDMMHYLKIFTDIAENVEKSESSVTKDMQSIREKITDMKLAIFKRANEIENELLLKVDSTERTIQESVRTISCDAEDEQKIIQSHLRDIAFVKENGNDEEAFLLSKSLSKYTSECENKLKILAPKLKDYKISLCEAPDFLSSFETFGEIKVEEQSRKSLIKFPKHDQAQEGVRDISGLDLSSSFKVRAFTTGIVSITATENGDVLLLEDNIVVSSKIIMYSMSGQLIGSVNISSTPEDICMIPETHMAVVTVRGWIYSSLQIINTKSLTLHKSIQLPVPIFNVNGIAATRKQIIVGSDNNIVVLNFKGELLRKYVVHAENVKFIQINQQAEYFYIYDRTLYYLQSDGNEKAIFKSNKLSSSSKFALHKNGSVFYIPKGSKDIFKLQTNFNQRSTCTLVDRISLVNPRFICFNKQQTKLYVANGIGDVAVYNCR